MNRFNLILLTLCLAPLGAMAQEGKVLSATGFELNQTHFWYRSHNAAGLAFAPMAVYHELSLGADYQNGKFHDVLTDGDRELDAHLKTAAAIQLGKFFLTGDIAYHNITTHGSLYNVSLYAPSFDVPYYVADWRESSWKRQSYDMGFRVAYPLGERVALGLATRYSNKVGGKQIDPRVETYLYYLDLQPSVVFRVNETHTLGLSALYYHSVENFESHCENYRVDQPAALMKGLGFYTAAMIGSLNGVDKMIYTTQRFGGALQWGMEGESLDGLLDVAFRYQTLGIVENPRFPLLRGSTKQLYGELSYQTFFGRERQHHLTLDGTFNFTTGHEIDQVLTKRPDGNGYYYQTKFEADKSHYLFVDADLRYDWYLQKTDLSYRWRFSADADFHTMRQDYIPSSYFNYMGAGLRLEAVRCFLLGQNVELLAGLHAGYHQSLESEYLYTGANNKTSAIVTGLYPSERDYLGANYALAGLQVRLGFTRRQKQHFYLDLRADGQKPLGLSTDRFTAHATLGFLF